ncbi:hypothetical protein ACFL6U_15905 [Planctomycetota bacterium]
MKNKLRSARQGIVSQSKTESNLSSLHSRYSLAALVVMFAVSLLTAHVHAASASSKDDSMPSIYLRSKQTVFPEGIVQRRYLFLDTRDPGGGTDKITELLVPFNNLNTFNIVELEYGLPVDANAVGTNPWKWEVVDSDNYFTLLSAVNGTGIYPSGPIRYPNLFPARCHEIWGFTMLRDSIYRKGYIQGKTESGKLTSKKTVPIPVVPGDLNKDNRVDAADVAIMAENMGGQGVGDITSNDPYKIPGDGVNDLDVALQSRVMSYYGVGTPEFDPNDSPVLQQWLAKPESE